MLDVRHSRSRGTDREGFHGGVLEPVEGRTESLSGHKVFRAGEAASAEALRCVFISSRDSKGTRGAGVKSRGSIGVGFGSERQGPVTEPWGPGKTWTMA